MPHIIVTTPKNQMATAAEEARQCIDGGGGFYFRTFRQKPQHLTTGTRIFYVEDGYVRGFGVVNRVVDGNMQCGTTGRDWGQGFHAIMDAASWKWIKPIAMAGFQGYRYFDQPVEIVGGWKDPKPVVGFAEFIKR